MSDEELNVESPLPENKENWLDIDDSTSLPSISLDEALLQLDQLDDTLILGLPGTAEEESILDGGAASFSGHSHQHHKEPSTPIRYTINCPIAWRKVESISHQITNSEQKIGRPKAVASNGNRLAVITSKGALLIFEESTERLLRLTFGNSELGAAACVTFSDDGSHIAIGYSKGGVKIVNASSGSTIATIHEAGQGGKGVLQIIFLTRQKTILVLDSGGSVFEIRVRKNLTGKSKEQVVCVFSGCNGEVVLMRYVRPHQILILVTLTKILIVSTNHGGSVMNSIPLQGPPNVPPLCDFFVSQDSKIVKLCAIRGRHLSLYHLFPRRFQQKRGRFAELISTIEVPLDLLGLSFLSEAFIWGVDSKEQVGVIDLNNKGWLPLSSTQTPLQLVYATSDFKGLATGANVSAALCCLAETVCYPAITAQNGIVFVLGVFLYRFKILNELEIIESFQERKDFGSAALYSLDLAKGKFHSQMQNVQAKVKGRMAGILSNLLDWTLDGMPNGKVSDLVVHYKKNIEILLRVCHQGDYMPFFYTRAYPRLEADSLARAVMFDLLDEAVLDGALVDPPPTLVADYLINLLHEGHFSQLQAATMRLPIYSIDIHWVMSTCRQNQLYDGIIHISNKALFDFIGPLEEMFANIAEFSDRDLRSDSEIEIGNKLLLYLHCCLAGRAYPFGELPSHLVDTVPIEVSFSLYCISYNVHALNVFIQSAIHLTMRSSY
ncbi:unnamed protein product, partial [Mesorhabditis belari]|uniref:Vacuolar protein sorting-associated protein 8 central domain-containing protein n=1 Tax=Mesorhabditis belari TaxID=2138241 RepID=A0AAF3FBU1_9BILA